MPKGLLIGITILCISPFILSLQPIEEKWVMQKDMQLFQNKCSCCHSEQVSLDLIDVLPRDLKNLIERMSQKKGAEIREDEREILLDFMIYYVAIARQPALHHALHSLPKPEKQSEMARIKAALNRYK